MVIKKDGCDLYELENVLSQYIRSVYKKLHSDHDTGAADNK